MAKTLIPLYLHSTGMLIRQILNSKMIKWGLLPALLFGTTLKVDNLIMLLHAVMHPAYWIIHRHRVNIQRLRA